MTVADRPPVPDSAAPPAGAGAAAVAVGRGVLGARRRRDSLVDAIAVPASASIAQHQLSVLLVAGVASGYLAGAPTAWLVAGLLGLSALAGMAGVVRTRDGRTIDGLVPGIVPAAVVVGGSLAIHALPPGVELLVGLAAIGLFLNATIGLERRFAMPGRTVVVRARDEDERLVVGVSLAAAFLGFVGVATLVPGALDAAAGREPMPVADLAVLVVADAAFAGALGLRLARLRAASGRNAALGGLSSGAIVAVAAAGLRALAIPFLLGPALLTLVYFLWDGVTGSTVARRRSPRWAWEIALLGILGACVTLLNLRVA